MQRYFTNAALDTLRALRATFLAFEDHAEGGAPVYWDSPEELRLYDDTFGCRIGWKWDAVLGELVRRERLPAGGTLVDWGCGTGVATRRFLAAGGRAARVHLLDHSSLAVGFARERLHEEHPEVEVADGQPEAPDMLLVSHVLGELSPEGLDSLLALARRSAAVIWVEPGSRSTSRRLGALRAPLAQDKDVLAPCTHQAACGALVPHSKNWCHFFARAPQKVYTEGRWAEFGRSLGIDLRSLPYSFLALARRGSFELAGPAARLLARPRSTRGRMEFKLCDVDGLRGVDYLQRTDKLLYKELEDVYDEPWLVDVELAGTRVKKMVRRDK